LRGASADASRGRAATTIRHAGNGVVDATIDWDGPPRTFALFTWEFVQHEAIHPWSVLRIAQQPALRSYWFARSSALELADSSRTGYGRLSHHRRDHRKATIADASGTID
jgi:hypothetical protein